MIAVALLAPCPAAAAPPEIGVAGPPDGCPASGAVAVALAAMLPCARVLVGGWDPSAQVVQVEDLGGRYRVSVAGAAREEADPARHCAERARVAAVFVTLTLYPPFAPATDAPPASAPTQGAASAAPTGAPASAAPPKDLELPGAVRAAAPVRGGGLTLRPSVEAAGLVAMAPASPGALPAAGGGAARLRLELWRRTTIGLGVALGAGAAAAATLELPHGRATLVRAPVDLDAYLAHGRGRVELLADLGVAGSALHVRGQGFTPDLATTILEWSLRLGAALRLWVAPRLGVGVGLEVSVVPRTYDLVVQPVGRLGATPTVWLDLTFGLCARFD
ncbi:MAG TPA: hypothetical protein VGQ83_15465 [Polyangia bacterium]